MNVEPAYVCMRMHMRLLSWWTLLLLVPPVHYIAGTVSYQSPLRARSTILYFYIRTIYITAEEKESGAACV